MKKILIVLISCIAMFIGSIFTHADSTTAPDQESTAPDSTIDVIGWFFKNDSVTYMIQQSDWRINGTDTTRVSGIAMTSQFVVTDSTASGYKIKYTILDADGDSIFESPLASFQSKMNLKLSKKLIGLTIRFETDQYGRIIKFSNLPQIKRKAKSIFKEFIDELQLMPEIKVLKKRGVNFENIFKNIDPDKLVEDYLNEIRMIFKCHGLEYKIGEFESHEEATDSMYEHYEYKNIFRNHDDDTYHILYLTEYAIPDTDIESFAGDLVNMLKSNFASEAYLNSPVNVLNGVLTNYTHIDYLSCGWPYYIFNQRNTAVNGLKKSRQLTITMTSYK